MDALYSAVEAKAGKIAERFAEFHEKTIVGNEENAEEAVVRFAEMVSNEIDGVERVILDALYYEGFEGDFEVYFRIRYMNLELFAVAEGELSIHKIVDDVKAIVTLDKFWEFAEFA